MSQSGAAVKSLATQIAIVAFGAAVCLSACGDVAFAASRGARGSGSSPDRIRFCRARLHLAQSFLLGASVFDLPCAQSCASLRRIRRRARRRSHSEPPQPPPRFLLSCGLFSVVRGRRSRRRSAYPSPRSAPRNVNRPTHDRRNRWVILGRLASRKLPSTSLSLSPSPVVVPCFATSPRKITPSKSEGAARTSCVD